MHECYVKPLKPRESLLTINESESDTETVEQSEVDNIEELVISDNEENEWRSERSEQVKLLGFIFNTPFVLKINQILKTHL